MLATIRSKIFCLLVSYIKTWILKYTELQPCPLFDMGEKLGSLTLKEGYRMRVFEDRLLRKIRGSKTLWVTDGRRKLQNKELTISKHFSGNKSKAYEISEAKGTYGWKEKCMQGFGGENWGAETTSKTHAQVVYHSNASQKQDKMAGSGQEIVVSSCGHGYERLGSLGQQLLASQRRFYFGKRVSSSPLNIKAPSSFKTSTRHRVTPQQTWILNLWQETGWAQSQNGRCGGNKNLLPCQALNHDSSVVHIKLHLLCFVTCCFTYNLKAAGLTCTIVLNCVIQYITLYSWWRTTRFVRNMQSRQKNCEIKLIIWTVHLVGH